MFLFLIEAFFKKVNLGVRTKNLNIMIKMNSPFIFLEEEKMNSPKTLKRTSFPIFFFFGKGKPHFHFISVIDVYTLHFLT